MGFVTGFARLTGAVSLDRHGQNDGGSLHLLTGCRVGRVDLVGVMTAAIEVHDVLIAQILNQLEGLRIFAEEMFAGIGTPIEFAVLKLPITDIVHDFLQQPALIALDQGIPFASPHYFDDVPAGSSEHALQLLNDFAITPTGPSRRCKLQLMTKCKFPRRSATCQRNRTQ